MWLRAVGRLSSTHAERDTKKEEEEIESVCDVRGVSRRRGTGKEKTEVDKLRGELLRVSPLS